MSKFFNETRSAGKTNSVPATANVDIQDLVGSLKQNMEDNGVSDSHSGEINLQHLLQPLEESHEVARQVTAGGVGKFRSSRPPPTAGRGLILALYYAAVQATAATYSTPPS